jgi:hypothetical protein
MGDDGVLALQAGTANQNYPECMLSCIKTLQEMDEFEFVAGYYGMVTTFFSRGDLFLPARSMIRTP